MICKKKRVTCMLLTLTTIIIAIHKPAYADEGKVVRVGYENVAGYEEGLEGEHKTGFGKELIFLKK